MGVSMGRKWMSYWNCISHNSVLEKAKLQGKRVGSPGGSVAKDSACQSRRLGTCVLDPWVRKIPWRRKWQPTRAFLPGESHGRGAWLASVSRVRHSWAPEQQVHLGKRTGLPRVRCKEKHWPELGSKDKEHIWGQPCPSSPLCDVPKARLCWKAGEILILGETQQIFSIALDGIFSYLWEFVSTKTDCGTDCIRMSRKSYGTCLRLHVSSREKPEEEVWMIKVRVSENGGSRRGEREFCSGCTPRSLPFSKCHLSAGEGRAIN